MAATAAPSTWSPGSAVCAVAGRFNLVQKRTPSAPRFPFPHQRILNALKSLRQSIEHPQHTCIRHRSLQYCILYRRTYTEKTTSTQNLLKTERTTQTSASKSKWRRDAVRCVSNGTHGSSDMTDLLLLERCMQNVSSIICVACLCVDLTDESNQHWFFFVEVARETEKPAFWPMAARDPHSPLKCSEGSALQQHMSSQERVLNTEASVTAFSSIEG